MSSDGINCYTYNDANQLSQVKNCSTNQVTAQYVYDYQGNRIEKKLYNGGSLQKTVYSPDKTYETVKQASSSGTTATGIWTTGSSSNWAAVIASFNSSGTTPAIVQKNKGNGGGTGSVATSFTSSVTTGHTIVVMTITASASNLDTTSVTDNQSNTYTQIGTTQHTSGNAYIRLWYAKNVTGGSVTVTAHQSGSASGCLMEILEYSGLSTTSPADQSASTTGTNTSPSGGSITPSGNNSLIVSAFTDDNSDSVSITGTSGYTVEESDLINSTSTRNGIEDQVQTGGGTSTANTSYYYVNNELAARKNPVGSKNYYLSDNLGSVSVLTNQSGTVIENSTYFPFGQIRSGGTQSKYLYTGQENDPETNLDYYNARYYNPSNLHFTQPDSELPNVYDPQQLNRYSYVRNNPMTVNDPTGHGPEIALAAFFADPLTAVAAAVGIGAVYVFDQPARIATNTLITSTWNAVANWDTSTYIKSGSKAIATNVAQSNPSLGGGSSTGGNPQKPSLNPFKKVLDILNNPSNPPGPDFEWNGQEPIGGDKGAWVNESNGDEQIHIDANHDLPKGPHIEYTRPYGNVERDGIDINRNAEQINDKGEVIGKPIPWGDNSE